MPSAKAADLGGDCCADLEERVAELEATTARKGNRKMSLTVTGQVNRMVLFWNDGFASDTYYGLDNTTSSTRFAILGSAKVDRNLSTGYEITFDIEAGGTSSKVSQIDEDGKIAHSSVAGNNISFNQHNVDSYFEIRRAAWWIEHKDVGRLTVGRWDMAGVVQTIDLGGVGAVAGASAQLGGVGSMYIRGSAGQFYNATWSNFMDGATANGRSELIRWDSPTWAGFIASASIGEAGDHWGVMLRYAGEFSGFRVAAGIGYEVSNDRSTPVEVNPFAAAFTGTEPEAGAWGGSLAVMHVPTGLFLQGHWNKYFYDMPAGTVSNSYYNVAVLANDATHWAIQGGIAQNWFGPGKTVLYGEYMKWEDFGSALGGRAYATSTACTTPPFTGNCASNFAGPITVDSSEVTMWGVGVVQNLDAAATELYLAYRNFELDISTAAGVSIPTENHWNVTAGARVKF
jgi:hypothetical protein